MTSHKFQHGYPFDPSHGYTFESLLKITAPDAPSDFAAFWEERYRRALDVIPEPIVGTETKTTAGWIVRDISFRSTGGTVIGGWLVAPASEVRRGLIVGHGYGGREAPDLPLPLADAAALFLCFRGIGRSRIPGINEDPFGHVLTGIDHRDRYILGGCAEDLWCAVSALTQLFPQAAGHVGYLGSSFGGGLGALAAPWDARISRAFLEVPSFGHHPLRLELPSTGSSDAVRAYTRRQGRDVLQTLRYFDAATAATFLRIPTLVAPACFDPSVPPPGQFAVHNAVPPIWRHSFISDAGHFEYAGMQAQQAALSRTLSAFLTPL